ncbi:MAG TPA: hypothetical protein VGI17_00110 [Solirubrobacterales bacterium]
MRVKRFSCALLAAFVLLVTVAMPAAAAVKLPVSVAAQKAFAYAKHTCAHDVHCIKYGTTNCRRISLHVVFCRMYVERSTPAQGRYACRKYVRVVLDPITDKIVVTGTSNWDCH